MRSARTCLAASGLAVLIAGWALAGDEDVRTLDRRFREVAGRAIPATVLVKSTLGDGSGRAGFGSGALISADGYVLTCSHVVDIAASVEVTLSTAETCPARILGKNPKQDYALLKIEATGLPHFKLGDSSRVALGDWVIALGHPGGPYPDLRPAFSVGRVTGLHRQLPVQMMDRFYDDAIRTDAPIFAGNSGGPLVSLKGELIGLNGAILLVNENSYAVPMNEIAANLERLKHGEQIAGRSPDGPMMPMDEFEGRDLAQFLGHAGRRLLGPDGLGKRLKEKGPEWDELARMLDRVGKSLEGERAQRTLEQFFEAFGGGGGGQGGPPAEPPDLGGLRKRLEDLFGGGDGGEGAPDLGKIGDRLKRIFGGGDGGEGDGKSGEPPRAEVGGGRPGPAAPEAYLGILPVTTSEASDLAGVRVCDVFEGSPAGRAGIRPGDVIIGLDRERIFAAGDLKTVLDHCAPGMTVKVRLLRVRTVAGVPVFEPIEVEATLAARDRSPAPGGEGAESEKEGK